MKTKVFYALVTCLCLSAFQSWATHPNMYAMIHTRELFTLPGQATVADNSADLPSAIVTAPDVNADAPAVAVDSSAGFAQSGLARYSDVGASLILIGLGGALVIFHRGKMGHLTDPTPVGSH
jgi:hypothetical protein